MIQHLFVYGTLMRAAAGADLGDDERRRLEEDGEWFGEARINGRIYDLGPYPILTAPEAENETVYGEAFRLRDPKLTFRWLDIYEGIPPGETRGAEYEQRKRAITETLLGILLGRFPGLGEIEPRHAR